MSKQTKVLKYRLSTKLNALPHKEYRIAMAKLPMVCQTSQRTFYRWLSLEKNDKQEIPADKLAILAKYFGCSVEEMFNYTIPQYNTKQLERMKRTNILDKLGLDK